MRKEQDLNVNEHRRAFQQFKGGSGAATLQETFDAPWYARILPHGRTERMTQETRGVFIPYPLLGIIITITCMVIAGIIAIEVQVSSLNTTLLLRDSDQRAEITATKEKLAQLEVYIHSDREKLIKIETQMEQMKRRSQ